MCFGGKKIKSLTINVNDKYIIWEENIEKIARNAELVVSAGCVGIYVVDGVLKNVCPAGKWLLKSKDEEKKKCALRLIGVNMEKVFEIRCGAGNIPFKDTEINAETLVGAHGSCKIKISHPWVLFTTMGKANVTAEEIDQYMKLKLGEIMTTTLAEVLQDYNYSTISTQQSDIANTLAKRCSVKLNDIGVQVEDFVLAGIKFSDEFKGQRAAFFEEENRKKDEKTARREKEREQRAEVDMIASIAKATQPSNAGAMPTPFTQNETNQSIKYCTKCGVKLPGDAAFCSVCGYKF